MTMIQIISVVFFINKITIPSSVTKIGEDAFSGCLLLSAEKIKSFDTNDNNK